MASFRRIRRPIILDSSESESEFEHHQFELGDNDESPTREENDNFQAFKESTLNQSKDSDCNDDEIEARMKDLAIEGRKKPFKSQLDSLKFDSSFSSSCSEIEGDSQYGKTNKKPDSTIELLDSSSSENEAENSSVELLSDSSHSVFRMKTPDSSISVLLEGTPKKQDSVQNIPQDSSFSNIDGYISSDDDDDDDDLVDSAWRKNKNGCYELKGKCSAAGNLKWPKLDIPKQLYDKLYDHQKIGVQFLASLHAKGIGGILGDDMGLGKTYQTCTLLAGLMRLRSIRNALIICPVAVMKNWERESRLILEHICGIGVTIRNVDSSIRRERRAMFLEEALTCPSSHPHIVITTYGLVKSSRLDFLAGRKDDYFYWDYIIADEGHILKNPNTDQHKAVSRIARNQKTHRILLTGTPIQNNMMELWALFDWATAGRLLGCKQRYLNQFAIPIEEGRNKNATFHTLKIASKANDELQTKLRPHFLQRMKNTEFKNCLPVKKELVVWLHLSDLQRQLYDDYVVDGGKVAAILSGDISSPLEAITWLKKLCDHPSLVSPENDSSDPDILQTNSSKLNVLIYLVSRLKKSSHRCLIFSPSTKMLDIMEKVLPVKLGRIDGSTSGKDRQAIVDKFNNDQSSFDALLLSTKAAGVGLTLTGADRAIIYSPSWNPSDDSQAVDRCYRIGQRNNVTVYRFITSGTVEEHMYARQVEKDGIRRTLMTSSGCATERHFSKDDLKKLFFLSPKGECKLLEKIRSKDPTEPQGSSGRRSILEKHEEVLGVSSHDGVYTNSIVNLSQPEQSPFSGTPVKPVRQNTFSFPTNDTFENIAKESVPVQSFSKQNHKTLSTPVKEKTEEKIEVQEEEPKTGVEDWLSKSLTTVDTLSNAGKIAESLELLLKVIESDELHGKQKLLLHKKIAARLMVLNWNDN